MGREGEGGGGLQKAASETSKYDAQQQGLFADDSFNVLAANIMHASFPAM